MAIKGTAVMPPVLVDVTVAVPAPVRLNHVSNVNCVAPRVDVAGPKVDVVVHPVELQTIRTTDRRRNVEAIDPSRAGNVMPLIALPEESAIVDPVPSSRPQRPARFAVGEVISVFMEP